jgi:hypothetical protein
MSVEHIDDIIKEIERRQEYDRQHPYKTFFKTVFWRWPVHRLPTIIKDFYYEIIYFFQRNIRGFSDRDFFQADEYIATTLANILEFIAENHTGYPHPYTNDEYTNKVRRIAEAFKEYTSLNDKEAKEIADFMCENKELFNTDKDEYYKKYDELRAKQAERIEYLCKIMEELFKDGFFTKLWD